LFGIESVEIVLGEIAAKLSTDAEIAFNLEFLELSRFFRPQPFSAH